ncbi:MAG: hypothetical protein J0H87_06185 [Holosporales bacterium]|nr:hypothetical protein [Holosporales bacterium]
MRKTYPLLAATLLSAAYPLYAAQILSIKDHGSSEVLVSSDLATKN